MPIDDLQLLREKLARLEVQSRVNLEICDEAISFMAWLAEQKSECLKAIAAHTLPAGKSNKKP